MELITTNNLLQCSNNTLASVNYCDAFGAFLDYFKNHKKKKESTIIAYAKNIKIYANYLEEKSIKTPNAKDLDGYISALEAQGKKPSTVQAYLNTLKQFYKWLEVEYDIKNIAQDLQATNKNDPTEFKKDYLTADQVATVLKRFDRKNAKSMRDYAIVSLMVCCGLRTIEVERANIEDLVATEEGAKLYIQGKGKGDKKKYVKVPGQVLKAINDYLATRQDQEPGAPLFISLSNNASRGGRMLKDSISKMVKKSFRSVGLDSERLTAHSLRHTTATLNLLNGGTLEETRQLLRHTNINTTLIYAHALERDKNQSEQRIANAILNF